MDGISASFITEIGKSAGCVEGLRGVLTVKILTGKVSGLGKRFNLKLLGSLYGTVSGYNACNGRIGHVGLHLAVSCGESHA